MFFVASKLLGFFTEPSNILMTLGVLGLVLLSSRYARAGLRLLVAAIILLAVVSYSPFGRALMLPLEDRFPPWQGANGPPVDGIVVLGGAVDEGLSTARGDVALAEGAERMTAALSLAQRFPAARILFTGGTNALVPGRATEAQYAGRFFVELGVDPHRVILEARSRNTAENAEFSKALADPKPNERWLLVTSAYHMPRSMALFRHAGFPVEAFPVDWRTRGKGDLWRPFARAADGLHMADVALHEWAGLIVYRLSGRTAELLPGPSRSAGAPGP